MPDFKSLHDALAVLAIGFLLGIGWAAAQATWAFLPSQIWRIIVIIIIIVIVIVIILGVV